MSTPSAPTPNDISVSRTAAADADAEAHRFGRPPENLPSLDPPPSTRAVKVPDGVTVEQLDLRNARHRKRFLDIADPIYEGDPNYIAPLRMHFMKFLDPAKNPFFGHAGHVALMVKRGDRPVGRVVAHVDREYQAYHGTKTGFFGFFECIDDVAVAHALLDEAVAWLRGQGVREIFGPMEFTTNHQCGLLVENFDRPPFVENTYNPPYYEELLTTYGFGKAKDLLIFMIDIRDGMDTPKRARIRKVADRVRKREGITVRPVDFSDVDREIERMYELYVKAWEKNWGFVALGKEEFNFLMGDLKMVAIADLVLFVEVDGKPVGFTATLPNVNEHMPKNGRLLPFNWLKMLNLKKTKSGRLITLGMLPEYRKRGLESIMFTETLLAGQRNGWTQGEIGWTLEDNDLVNRAIESMEGRLDRRYRILGATLGEGS